MNSIKRITNLKKTLRCGAKAFKILSKWMLSLPFFIGKKIGKEDLSCNLLMPFSEAVEAKSNCYITYNITPKYAKEQNNWLYYSGKNVEKFCIVIQGPIIKKDDYTLETIRYYQKIYPGILIVVSTWENEEKTYLEKIREEKNCVVRLSKQPVYSGNGNINYQIISSLNGAKEAKKQGKEYILKTRSDTRITQTGIMDILYQYLEKYLLKSVTEKKQKKRLVLFNAYLFHPYHSSDFFVFGNVDDVIGLYDIELNYEEKKENIANQMVANQWSYQELFLNPNGENEIWIKYFSKINGAVQCELQEWWSVLGQYTIALPINILRPIWVKYDYNHEESNFYMTYRRSLMGGDAIDNTIVSFSMWIDMFELSFSLSAKEYEDLINLPMS